LWVEGQNNRNYNNNLTYWGLRYKMEEIDIVLEVDGKKIPMNGFVKKYHIRHDQGFN